MAIGVFFYPDDMTSEQYNQVLQKLEAAGQAAPKGRQQHFAFGNDASLVVVDVWESFEDFDAFADYLAPILQELSIDTEPTLLELYNSIPG
jgi:hypothetical protein